jgi:adenylate cyclase
MSRVRLSYRASLVTVIPLLVLVTSGVVTYRAYRATEASITSLSEELFREVSSQTVTRTRAHLTTAEPSLDVLSSLETRAVLAHEDEAILMPRLLAMLRANPGFSWVSYGDRTGSFAAAYRPSPGIVRLNQSHQEGERSVLDERDLHDDGTSTPFRHEDDSHYDPRTRPWYRAALDAGHRVWLRPYVFFNAGIPGITCATPQRDETGALAGVYTVDFDLGALSRFVAELELSPHGTVFVFTEQGELLAHPSLETVVVDGASEGRIVLLDDLDDPLMRRFREELAQLSLGSDETRALAFESGDELWRGSLTTFAIDEGLVWRVAVLAPESDFMGAIERANRESALIGLVAILLAVLTALFLANRVARPLEQLARLMVGVGRLELDGAEEAPSSIFREIDGMGRALTRMKQGLRSFGRFVPRDLVSRLLREGGEAKLGGEVRELTVFFSDIAGFTTLAETMPPAELVEKLSGYLDAMASTIAQEGGTVDKFIGDGIMAFWGAPTADASHAASACIASLRCQDVLAKLERSEGGAWMKGTHTRIGIATGELLVGNIGTKERLNYTVMGDVANLAARLESLSKQYGTRILVSEATMTAARDRVVGRVIDLVAVKGKLRGVRVYELLAIRGERGEADAIALAARCDAALDDYLARRFEDAREKYDALARERPDDRVASILRDRASRYAAAPPADDWDGAHAATEK